MLAVMTGEPVRDAEAPEDGALTPLDTTILRWERRRWHLDAPPYNPYVKPSRAFMERTLAGLWSVLDGCG
ncbi:hypothetical protein [Streptomyces sp. TM32]|uniref:hypothetical protein n=1 Tax=Streptomyces sp. TM32 TaxID=1652669 RepID=UPI0015775B7B|nr:hypothetical protein [Streptomyces sp. TM32]